MQYTLFTVVGGKLEERACTFEEFVTTTMCRHTSPISPKYAYTAFSADPNSSSAYYELESRLDSRFHDAVASPEAYAFLYVKGIGLFMVYDDQQLWTHPNRIPS